MNTDQLFDRFRELQSYVVWTDVDLGCITAAAPRLEPRLPELIEDFYAEITLHPQARRVITGGQPQIDRLKGTLLNWIRELLAGRYDRSYVERRWRVGWRHVEIGLDQVYTNVALSRLRSGLTRILEETWVGDPTQLLATIRALNKMLDLDLAIIEEAYQTEYTIRLQQSERLATLGQVAGGVAHELRNPLNVVKTSVYYLLNARNPTPEKTAEHLNRIERQVAMADGVITALTNFAKMPVPSLNHTEIEPIIREILEAYPPGAAIKVEIELPGSLPAVLADADQLRIVLGNLVRNACDAMTGDGRLSIRAVHVDGAVEVAVADTGVGIAKDDLLRIMEPLYSTKARGLGLGLAISKAILDKSRASMRFESELGRGSIVTVRLLSSCADGEQPHDGTGGTANPRR